MILYLIESNISNLESKVVGIILTGKASMEGMEEIKLVIGKALPEYGAHFCSLLIQEW